MIQVTLTKAESFVIVTALINVYFTGRSGEHIDGVAITEEWLEKLIDKFEEGED